MVFKLVHFLAEARTIVNLLEIYWVQGNCCFKWKIFCSQMKYSWWFIQGHCTTNKWWSFSQARWLSRIQPPDDYPWENLQEQRRTIYERKRNWTIQYYENWQKADKTGERNRGATTPVSQSRTTGTNIARKPKPRKASKRNTCQNSYKDTITRQQEIAEGHIDAERHKIESIVKNLYGRNGKETSSWF